MNRRRMKQRSGFSIGRLQHIHREGCVDIAEREAPDPRSIRRRSLRVQTLHLHSCMGFEAAHTARAQKSGLAPGEGAGGKGRAHEALPEPARRQRLRAHVVCEV